MYRLLIKKNESFYLGKNFATLKETIEAMIFQKAVGYLEVVKENDVIKEKKLHLFSKLKNIQKKIEKSSFFIKNEVTEVCFFQENYIFVILAFGYIKIDALFDSPEPLICKKGRIYKYNKPDFSRRTVHGIAKTIQNVVVKIAISKDYVLNEEYCLEHKLPYETAIKTKNGNVFAYRTGIWNECGKEILMKQVFVSNCNHSKYPLEISSKVEYTELPTLSEDSLEKFKETKNV